MSLDNRSNHQSHENELLSDDDLQDNIASDDREIIPLLGREAPRRGQYVVYLCFLILGLCTLLPWNFFITAESYWMYKFRNTSKVNFHTLDKTYLQNIYTPLQVCLSQVTNFLFLFINAIFSQFISQKIRLIGSLLIMLVFFSLTTALSKVDTDSWQLGFFILTMAIIIITSASVAVFQGGVFGLAGSFPQTFINSMVIGQALGGVFAAVARIGSIYFGVDPVTSAFIYFLIAVVVMVITLLEYLYVSRMDYFKHYSNREVGNFSSPSTTFKSLMKDHSKIFKKIWPLGISVCFVFLVTLSIFPVMCVRIVSSSQNKVWRDTYFQPVVTFLLFNVCDFISRYMAEWIMWPRKGSSILYVIVGLRLVFIPLFLLCNHSPSSDIPSIFINDIWYIVFMIIFALSNGYCTSLIMMYAPKMVGERESEKAGSMLAAMIGLGLLLGSAFSFAFALIS